MATTTFILDIRSIKERVLKLLRKGGIPQGYEFADTEIALKTMPPAYDVATFNGVANTTLLPAKPGVRYHIFGMDINAHNNQNTNCYRISITATIKGVLQHVAICYLTVGEPNGYSGSKYTPGNFLTDENTAVSVNFDGMPEGARGIVFYKEVLDNAV